ncbi:TetR/AcrR family transcriptional regulator [Georgenia ruanii]|uniref:TetR family transcriptional regulator n=1 Tax=Georgenia ruanii TaxID=348442 RepID=A0A7J9URL6_9MICO|nr:TetR family transcriptional regulator [Georgenia ruanii]MPV87255.1 TetR family transcriptional regulator [Georgenia ruanii]
MAKRTGLSEDAVAQRALALIDADGIEGLSMRKLAAELGVSTMTLYSYFPDRAALLDGVAQAIYAQIDAPEDAGGPRETLRVLMRGVRRVLLAHPHALPLIAEYPPRTLAALAFINAGFRALRRAGVGPRDTARAYRALAAYSLGTAQVEINGYFRAGEGPAAGRPESEESSVEVGRILPYLAEVGPLLGELDDAGEFDYGLDLTLDGFMGRHAT